MIENAHLSYGRSVPVASSFEQALARVKALLKEEGFGILCEIDVAKTLAEKIGVTFRPYVILGACNPRLAYKALNAEPHLGLLLPCSFVVQEQEGHVAVSAVDARAMLGVVGNSALAPIADDAGARFNRILDALS